MSSKDSCYSHEESKNIIVPILLSSLRPGPLNNYLFIYLLATVPRALDPKTIETHHGRYNSHSLLSGKPPNQDVGPLA